MTCNEQPLLKSSPRSFKHLPQIPAACTGPARLCALCHRRKSRLASWLRSASVCESMHITAAGPEPPQYPTGSRCHPSKHLQKLSCASSHIHLQQPPPAAAFTARLTFLKLRTHSRTFSRLPVSISQSRAVRVGKAASRERIPQPERRRRSSGSGQLQHRAADWRTDAVGLVSPLPQTIRGSHSVECRPKTTYLIPDISVKLHLYLNCGSEAKKATTRPGFPATPLCERYCLFELGYRWSPDCAPPWPNNFSFFWLNVSGPPLSL